MAIDFSLTPQHRKLQLQSREFARDTLAGATSAELLATPEERFLATKPIYEAMVAAGFLRKCIPAEAGGGGTRHLGGGILLHQRKCQPNYDRNATWATSDPAWWVC
jgi:nitroalkane oxidase